MKRKEKKRAPNNSVGVSISMQPQKSRAQFPSLNAAGSDDLRRRREWSTSLRWKVINLHEFATTATTGMERFSPKCQRASFWGWIACWRRSAELLEGGCVCFALLPPVLAEMCLKDHTAKKTLCFTQMEEAIISDFPLKISQINLSTGHLEAFYY